MTALTPLTQAATGAGLPQGGKAKLAAAAQQFEAIFIRQMLSDARKASFGDPLFSSDAVDTFREMQDARFADLASQRGVFGLAQSIERQLAATVGGGASTSSARAGPGAGINTTSAQPELTLSLSKGEGGQQKGTG